MFVISSVKGCQEANSGGTWSSVCCPGIFWIELNSMFFWNYENYVFCERLRIEVD